MTGSVDIPDTLVEAFAPKDPHLSRLGPGKRKAILLAEELGAAHLLLDDLAGRRLGVTGTVGVLQAAAKEGLLDFMDALTRLRRTNFHLSQKLYDQLVAGANR